MNYDYNEKEEEGEEGKGGQTGAIHFRYRDAAQLGPRDDELPPSEIKRLLVVHRDLHKQQVDKQKLTRKDRAALKEGKMHLPSANQRLGGGHNQFKKHPLSNKAQFSGMDRQTTTIPNDFIAETNADLRDKLENRFVHRNVPKFNPKPRPPGG